VPRIALQRDVLDRLRDKVLRSRGVAFNMDDDGQVYAMLKYWAEEMGGAGASVTIVMPREKGRYLVTCSSEFLQSLQKEV
jgi:hypothetical protein